MKDVLFIQFYSKIENTNPRFKGHSIYELCNGFSDTYDLCKSKGDFYWVNHSKQLYGYGKNKIEKIKVNLPIEYGTAYVSVYYLSQLYQCYQWALQYPNIHFVVGGPAANSNVFTTSNFTFPINMYLTTKTMEEYFNVPNFSSKWNLELPDNDESMTLSYTYTLSSFCYWGKCIFCNYSQGSRKRPNINFEFEDINYTGKQRVNLYTPSTTSAQIKELLYKLDYNKKIRYDIYLRGNESERKALTEIFSNKTKKLPQIKFIVGIEFPSNRMLKYIKKNITVSGALETINILANQGHEAIQIQLPFILGWNNLELNDIIELENFLNQLPYDKIKFAFSVNLLSAKLNTYVFNNYERKKELYIGPFYYGFIPSISSEQMKLSKKAVEILFEQGVTVFDYHNIRNM